MQTIEKESSPKKRNYMFVNVILSFNSFDDYGGTQEMFDLHIPINKNEKNAISFVNEKLFKRIVGKCKQYGRNAEDLYKISTASDWDLFEKVTGQQALTTLGHNCKWYFNEGVNDLDQWELNLMDQFNFGKNS